MLSSSITLRVIGRHGTASLKFVTNQRLLGLPALSADGFTLVTREVSGTDGEQFSYQYSAPSAALDGLVEGPGVLALLEETGEASTAAGTLGVAAGHQSGRGHRPGGQRAQGPTARPWRAHPRTALSAALRRLRGGLLFQTCATSTASAAAPATLTCGATGFTERTNLGLRLKPTGFSNTRPVGLHYR